jgi:hypothetical protein
MVSQYVKEMLLGHHLILYRSRVSLVRLTMTDVL